MKKYTRIFIALTFVAACATAGFAQSNDAKTIEQILKLEARHTEAAKNWNIEAINRLETEDFLMTVRIPPRTISKAENTARVSDKNFRRGTTESYTTDADLKVRVYGGDTAIVTGAWKRKSRDADGEDTSASGRYTHVWVKQNGKWLLAAAHYSPDIDLEKLKSGSGQTENKKIKSKGGKISEVVLRLN